MKKRIFAILIILTVALSLWYSPKEPVNQATPEPVIITDTAEEPKNPQKAAPSVPVVKEEVIESPTEINEIPVEINEEPAPVPVNECTLSVRCNSLLNNMDKVDKNKLGIIPENGIIFPETKVVFYEGESTFNVLSREMKKNGIHLDFVKTPMYNTIYIKGISNLYEKDAGDLSGWIYAVNGEVPGFGCSQYTVKSGDKIEFIYTCDSGRDIYN